MTDLRTYKDLTDQLVYHLGAAADERNQSQVRMAVRNAYRDLVQKRNWNFFWKQDRLFLNPPYTTGTIAYTQSNLTLTLTGGTWPSWASNYCRIRIGTVTSQIASMAPGGTTAILDSNYNFGADIAAGASFVLYQNLFPLPDNFRAMGNPIGEASWWSCAYVTPENWLQLERAYGGTTNGGVPLSWTIFGDPNNQNGLVVALWPWPVAQKTLDFIYQAAARPLVRHGETTADQGGTVSCAASATVTGTNTAWVSAQAGSVIRFGDATNVPTGIEGIYPYQEQATIKSVDSATQFTLTAPTAGTYTNVKYVVSDPVNLPERMITSLIRRVELEISDLKDRGSYDSANARWIKAYFEAGEADQNRLSPQFATVTTIPTRPPLRYMPYVAPT